MKVLIAGAGSTGTRYATLLQTLTGPEILVVEPDAERLSAFCRAVAACPAESLDSALSRHPDAAIICSPTSMHVSHCIRAVRGGCHVLLESPISNNLVNIDLLLEEARSRSRVVLVSCNLRFHPALARMKQWLRAGVLGRVLSCRASCGRDLRLCRAGRDYRTVYAATRELGGGVLLDSVHDLDYLTWFFGGVESVSAMTARLSDLQMDAEDSANLLLRFKSGVDAVVQFDYFRPEYHRSCEIIGTEGILQWGYYPKALRYYSRRYGVWSMMAIDDNGTLQTMYSEQLRHFLECMAGRAEPAHSIADAAATLNIALSAAQSADSGREVAVPSVDRLMLRRSSGVLKPVQCQSKKPDRIVTIIQAHMSSSRLPGKVFADICGKPMLARVLDRVGMSKSAGEVFIATSDDPGDDVIESFCSHSTVPCFRGSNSDVLDRYYQCAKLAKAETVVRICSDCPLIDPQLIDATIAFFRKMGVDYVSNRRYGAPQPMYAFPDGLDVEVFSFDAMSRAYAEATWEYDRTHVTPFIWRNFRRFRVLHLHAAREFAHRGWTVDFPEDLEFVREVWNRFRDGAFSLDNILEFINENPELASKNAHIIPQGDWRYGPRVLGAGHLPGD